LRNLEALGGTGFVAELIDHFVQDAEELTADLVLALRDGDVQAFRMHAHALRSAAANLGAKRLVELCGTSNQVRAEELGAQGDALALRFSNEAQSLRAALLDYRSAPSLAERQ